MTVYAITSADHWVLMTSASTDRRASPLEACPCEPAPPAAIVLTHGHFDDVGALPALVEQWPVPVYAHSAEMPHSHRPLDDRFEDYGG